MLHHVLNFSLYLFQCSGRVSSAPQRVASLLGGHPEEEEAEDEVDFGGCGDEPIEESELLLILDEFHEHIENCVETVDPDITLDFQDSTL